MVACLFTRTSSEAARAMPSSTPPLLQGTLDLIVLQLLQAGRPDRSAAGAANRVSAVFQLTSGHVAQRQGCSQRQSPAATNAAQ